MFWAGFLLTALPPRFLCRRPAGLAFAVFATGGDVAGSACGMPAPTPAAHDAEPLGCRVPGCRSKTTGAVGCVSVCSRARSPVSPVSREPSEPSKPSELSEPSKPSKHK